MRVTQRKYDGEQEGENTRLFLTFYCSNLIKRKNFAGVVNKKGEGERKRRGMFKKYWGPEEKGNAPCKKKSLLTLLLLVNSIKKVNKNRLLIYSVFLLILNMNKEGAIILPPFCFLDKSKIYL